MAGKAVPFRKLASKRAIAFTKKLKLMRIPWTVDDLKTAETLKLYGANGIVTNKPDLLIKLK